jgi:hypothetical protein
MRDGVTKEYVSNVRKGFKRRGKMNLLRWLDGKRITRQQAIVAKCYDCNGMGEATECDVVTCPLHGYGNWSKVALRRSTRSSGGKNGKFKGGDKHGKRGKES